MRRILIAIPVEAFMNPRTPRSSRPSPSSAEVAATASDLAAWLAPVEAERQAQAQTEAAQRALAAQRQAREAQFVTLLSAVRQCQPGVLDSATDTWITDATFYAVLARRLGELARFLQAQGWQDRLGRLPADRAAQLVQQLLWAGMRGADNEVADILRRADGRDQFAAELRDWLYGQLQTVLLPEVWPPRIGSAPAGTPVGEIPGLPPPHLPLVGNQAAVASALRQLLRARPELRTAKRSTLIKTVHARKRDVLAALRRLKQEGLYLGPPGPTDD